LGGEHLLGLIRKQHRIAIKGDVRYLLLHKGNRSLCDSYTTQCNCCCSLCF
jgi:hypothetical protein